MDAQETEALGTLDKIFSVLPEIVSNHLVGPGAGAAGLRGSCRELLALHDRANTSITVGRALLCGDRFVAPTDIDVGELVRGLIGRCPNLTEIKILGSATKGLSLSVLKLKPHKGNVVNLTAVDGQWTADVAGVPHGSV